MVCEFKELCNDQYLAVGDYLVSKNRLFFAILKSDAVIQVYRGSVPNDSNILIALGAPVLWKSDSEQTSHSTNYFAWMQPNGVFGIYKGTDPKHNEKELWHWTEAKPVGRNYRVAVLDDGNFCIYEDDLLVRAVPEPKKQLDPIVKFEVSEITYTGLTSNPLDEETVDTKTISNPDTVTAAIPLELGKMVKQKSKWNQPLLETDPKDFTEASCLCPVTVPIVNDNNEIVMTTLKDKKILFSDIQRDKCEKFSTAVNLKPHEKITFSLFVERSAVIARIEEASGYFLKGKATYKSGSVLDGATLTGIYEGTNTHSRHILPPCPDVVNDNVTHEKTSHKIPVSTK